MDNLEQKPPSKPTHFESSPILTSPFETQSKRDIEMAYPKPCKEPERRISAPNSGWCGLSLAFIYSGLKDASSFGQTIFGE